MEQEQINKLAQKFLEGTATEAEQKMLHDWYDSIQVHEELPVDGEALRLRMQQAIADKTVKRQPWIKRLTAAAAILLLITAGTYFLQRNKQVQTTKTHPYKEDAAPGTNKAILTLYDGTTIELDSSRNGALGKQGNTTILKTAGGQLAYQSSNQPASQEIHYNKVVTPRGGQYQIMLPDGTKVWLNAESSLYFPAEFTGKERNVKLTGEAYFEVAHNAQAPFIVSVADVNVEVLGTHFNVMAYTDEHAIKTSLFEGAVKIKDNLLRPGQQMQVYKDGRFKVVTDPFMEDAIAWKDGMFVFNNDNLDNIMRRLSRWYDVEISFSTDKIRNNEFTGQISRHEKLSEVLKMLELTDAVHFEIERKKIIAMP
ncbi:FecR family protein [Chitinophaga niabensis]|uniref:FecR family protein n=1 Tax=Chitinophaga niabensis TaxID=536979 RepID=UPI0031BBA7B1